jgi:hypothetical protein
VFTLIVSHVRLSMQVDLVRARSVFQHRALPAGIRLLAIGFWLLASSLWQFRFSHQLIDEGTGHVAGAFVFAVMLVEYRRDIWGSQ